MYEKEFQLKSRPFLAGSRAEFWCQIGNSAQAVEQVCRTLNRGSGISVLIGGAGTGKTLVLEIIARRFADRNPEVVQIACSRLDKRCDVLQRILFELNLPCREMSDSDLRLTVVQHFRSICGQHGREVLLLVDEAHNLDVELIDELRIIVESASRQTGKCHLVLAGTARLEDHLNHSNLETFNQRISCRAYLQPMDREETAIYVSQHMTRAGGGKREFFAPDALRELARVTGGIPRLVNQVCDQCLVVCAGSGAARVDQNMVTDAWCDIQNLPRQTVDTAASGKSKSGTDSAAGSSFEFGSLDDANDPVASQPTKKTESARSKKSAGAASQPDDPGSAAIEHDFSVVSLGLVAQASDENPFGENFADEEPVPSTKPHTARNPKSKPVVELPVVPANEKKNGPVHTQIVTSTMDGFPPYQNELEADFGSRHHFDQPDVEVSTNPICDDPAMDELDTLPIPETTESETDNEDPVQGVDDRDMLVSADATIFEPTSRMIDDDAGDVEETPKPPATLKGPHKSGAVRMEYRKLFAQLRSEAS